MKKELRADLIYKTTIKTMYGLPESWIARLGAPDKVTPNPHYRSAAPSILYQRERVEALIDANQEEYKELLVQREARSAAATSAAQSKRQQLLEAVEKWDVSVQGLPKTFRDLRRDTRDHLNYLLLARGKGGEVSTIGFNAILAYVRHNLTRYEEYLTHNVEGNIGCHEAYIRLKDRVIQATKEAIVAKYGVAF